ncbi:MAG: RNA 3'-terminal phosphate cyclase [Thaumarchaeota archaeon]|nr:RNA 3'-terminal phosphate cyclase [Nitrososphaerota archaeon]
MVEEERVIVDGARGEGGGQILRTSIALSILSRKPVEVINIRAKRSNPGLRAQHLSAVKALAAVFNAYVEDAVLGSKRIYFIPREQKITSLDFDIGTAGSITLLLQAIIPAVSLGGGSIDVKLIGGTDVSGSPTMDYFRNIVLPAYRLLGVEVELEVLRRGYYPKGGGIVKVSVKPRKTSTPLRLGKTPAGASSILSVCSNLPRSVAERQASSAKHYLESRSIHVGNIEIRQEEAVSPGTAITVFQVDGKSIFIGGDNIGRRDLPAEKVGREAAARFTDEYSLGVPVDRHLSDMLVPMLVCTEGESQFLTSEVTGHLETNLRVARMFTSCGYELAREERGVMVRISGKRLRSNT